MLTVKKHEQCVIIKLKNLASVTAVSLRCKSVNVISDVDYLKDTASFSNRLLAALYKI